MQEKTTQTDLSERLQSYRNQLRQDPTFRELVDRFPRSRLKPWHPRAEGDQDKLHVYQSGLVDGEERLMSFLLGHDR